MDEVWPSEVSCSIFYLFWKAGFALQTHLNIFLSFIIRKCFVRPRFWPFVIARHLRRSFWNVAFPSFIRLESKKLHSSGSSGECQIFFNVTESNEYLNFSFQFDLFLLYNLNLIPGASVTLTKAIERWMLYGKGGQLFSSLYASRGLDFSQKGSLEAEKFCPSRAVCCFSCYRNLTEA